MESAFVQDGVTQVSVGAEYSCAVRRDGHVWCWGNSTVLSDSGYQRLAPRNSQVDLSARQPWVR